MSDSPGEGRRKVLILSPRSLKYAIPLGNVSSLSDMSSELEAVDNLT